MCNLFVLLQNPSSLILSIRLLNLVKASFKPPVSFGRMCTAGSCVDEATAGLAGHGEQDDGTFAESVSPLSVRGRGR